MFFPQLGKASHRFITGKHVDPKRATIGSRHAYRLRVNIPGVILQPENVPGGGTPIKSSLMECFKASTSVFYDARVFLAALSLVVQALPVAEAKKHGKPGKGWYFVGFEVFLNFLGQFSRGVIFWRVSNSTDNSHRKTFGGIKKSRPWFDTPSLGSTLELLGQPFAFRRSGDQIKGQSVAR